MAAANAAVALRTLWCPGTSRPKQEPAVARRHDGGPRQPAMLLVGQPHVRVRRLPVGQHPDPFGPRVLRERPRPGVVRASDQQPARGDRPDEGPVCLLDRGEVAVEVEVVGLHARDDRDLGPIDEERPVALVGLDDEDVATAEVSVGPVLRQLAADRERRVDTAGLQSDGQQRRRRGLAVGARDRYASRPGHRGGQRLGPVQDRDPLGMRGAQLRVRVPDGRRDHHGVGVVNQGRVVAHVDGGTLRRQRVQQRRLARVGARHGHPLGQHDPGDTGHARAADRDEVHAAEILRGGYVGEEVEPRLRQRHDTVPRDA